MPADKGEQRGERGIAKPGGGEVPTKDAQLAADVGLGRAIPGVSAPYII